MVVPILPNIRQTWYSWYSYSSKSFIHWWPSCCACTLQNMVYWCRWFLLWFGQGQWLFFIRLLHHQISRRRWNGCTRMKLAFHMLTTDWMIDDLCYLIIIGNESVRLICMWFERARWLQLLSILRDRAWPYLTTAIVKLKQKSRMWMLHWLSTSCGNLPSTQFVAWFLLILVFFQVNCNKYDIAAAGWELSEKLGEVTMAIP